MSITGSRVALLAFKVVYRLRMTAVRVSDRLLDTLLAKYFASKREWQATYSNVGELESETKPRWTARTRAAASLTVVVVTYKMPAALNSTLAAFECQTMQNFDLIVLHDGPDEATRRVVNERPSSVPHPPMQYIETEIRYNDYGHSLRDIGIGRATGDFLLITNGDNYYSPRFVEFAFDAIEAQGLDLVMWNFVHSHVRPGGTPFPSYSPFSTFPLLWRIDIGAMLVRTSIAKRVGFRDKSHDGDAAYLQDMLELDQPIRMGKIEKTLMIHN